MKDEGTIMAHLGKVVKGTETSNITGGPKYSWTCSCETNNPKAKHGRPRRETDLPNAAVDNLMHHLVRFGRKADIVELRPYAGLPRYGLPTTATKKLVNA